MKNRYSRIVLKQTGQQDLDVIRGKNNELIINVRSSKNDRFKTPPIPKGYRYVCGKWNDGFVIERKIDRSQFVWVPVGSLKSNGTLDGIHYSEKFGRRKWRMNNEYDSDKLYFDPLTKEFIEQVESVDKYQGFYVSRFNISRNKKTNKQQSVRNEYPLGGWNFFEIEDRAYYFEKQDTVKSHLLFGCEYDSILEWFMDSGARSKDEIFKDSSNWGHFSESLESYKKRYNDYLKTDYWNDPAYWRCYGDEIPISRDESERKKTGTSEEWQTNRIYDLAGNLLEVTQERHFTRLEAPEIVCRGTNYLDEKYRTVVARRIGKDNSCLDHCSYRIALWIK